MPEPTKTPLMANDVSSVNMVKQDIYPDLILNMSGATTEDLTRIGVDTSIHNVENEDVRFVYVMNDAVARAYNPDKPTRAKTGKAYKRVLRMHNVISGVPDNVQNYRASQPFSMLGVSDQGADASAIIAHNLRVQTIAFGNQIVSGAFDAEYDPDSDDPLNMYDGYNVGIEKDLEDTLISAAMGNYATIPTVTYVDPLNPTEAECISAYNRFISFCNQMNKYLLKNAIVACSIRERRNIVAGYAFKFKHAQTIILNAPEFVSHEAPTVKLIGTDLIADGTTRIYGYVEKNPQFATDLTRSTDPTKAYISIDKDPEDPLNKILISMQMGVGTRILDFNKQKLCISSGTVVKYAFESDGVAQYAAEHSEAEPSPEPGS